MGFGCGPVCFGSFCVSVAVSNTCVDRSPSAQITTAEKLLGAADASNALEDRAEKHALEDSQVRFSENPLVSEDPNASTIVKQLGFGTTRQKSAPCVEGEVAWWLRWVELLFSKWCQVCLLPHRLCRTYQVPRELLRTFLLLREYQT